jgi:hypothetical protein
MACFSLRSFYREDCSHLRILDIHGGARLPTRCVNSARPGELEERAARLAKNGDLVALDETEVDLRTEPRLVKRPNHAVLDRNVLNESILLRFGG